MRALLVLWFLNFLSFFGFSQVPNHIFLGREQFANTDVYGVIYTEDHRLIVATNKGMWQYSYTKEKEGFRQFSPLKEQKSNSFFDLKKDQKGAVYCKNLKNQIFRIKDNKIELYYELSAEDKCNEFYYFVDDQGDLIIFGMRIIKLDASRKVTVLYDPKAQTDEWPEAQFFRVRQAKDGTLKAVTKGTNGIAQLSYSDGTVSVSLLENIEWSNGELPSSRSKLNYFHLGNKPVFFSDALTLGSIGKAPEIDVELNGIERFYQLDDRVIGLHESRGFRLFSIENNTLRSSEILFPNTFISTMYSDSHGTLFLGTFGEGIMVVPQTNSLQYYTNSLISDFDVLQDNTVYLSTREGKVLHFKNGIFTEESNQKTNIDFLVASPFLYEFSKQPFFTDVVPKLTGFGRTKDAFATPNGIYVATNNGIYYVANNSDKNLLPSHFKKIPDAPNFVYNIYGNRRFNVITVNETSETIYFANDEHLFMMGKDGEVSKIYFEGKGIRCSDAAMWEGQLVVATPNQGILFFKEGAFQKGIRFNKNGLISDNVEKIIIKKDELFIHTDRGIQIIQLRTGEMKFLGFKEGLTTNLISDFSVSHDKLWIQEKHKIYAIDLRDISHQEQAVSFEIDSILISGKTPVSGTNFDLAYDDKSLQVFLNYRDILRIGEAYFEYRINGEEWQRIPAKRGVLELNNLSTGSYDLEIRLHYRNEISSTKNIYFSMIPPIWMRWWFYPLILLALTGFLILFYRRKLRKQEAHARHMNELNTSKMTALQSQMNPHFIFNALNSIQHLVMRGNKEEAYKFITQFANLVRRTLDYSEQETIPIKDEIDLLKVYLNLEKLRFKDEFDFEFVVNELRDVRIPPMLMQPFIENALLHGLLHKEGKKRLKLIVEMNDNSVHCWVEDNGIGRDEAKRIRQRQRGDHKSFALKAMDNRFRILRESYHADIGYSYEDLSPENELDWATRVHLKIPIHS